MALQIDKESKNLLLVWVYYPAVGHYVEAIDVAAAYKNSNPNFNIFILLNNETTYKLTEFCGWINGCFIVDVKDVVLNNKNALCLNEIPKSWDYIIYPKRLKYTPSDFSSSLLECNKILQNILIAKESIEYHYENEKNN